MKAIRKRYLLWEQELSNNLLLFLVMRCICITKIQWVDSNNQMIDYMWQGKCVAMIIAKDMSVNPSSYQ